MSSRGILVELSDSPHYTRIRAPSSIIFDLLRVVWVFFSNSLPQPGLIPQKGARTPYDIFHFLAPSHFLQPREKKSVLYPNILGGAFSPFPGETSLSPVAYP